MFKLGVFLAGGTLEAAPTLLAALALLLSGVSWELVAERALTVEAAGLPLVGVRLAERLR